MNPDHAVDVYRDPESGTYTLIRRNGNLYLRLEASSNAKDLGHAVLSGLDGDLIDDFSWKHSAEDLSFDQDNAQIAVAWRESGELIISSPLTTNSPDPALHPRIMLQGLPRFELLGEAVRDSLNNGAK